MPQPRRSSAPYVVVLLVLVAALAAAAYAVSTRETVLTPLPEVSSELPDTLRSDLQRLRDAAERLEER